MRLIRENTRELVLSREPPTGSHVGFGQFTNVNVRVTCVCVWLVCRSFVVVPGTHQLPLADVERCYKVVGWLLVCYSLAGCNAQTAVRHVDDARLTAVLVGYS